MYQQGVTSYCSSEHNSGTVTPKNLKWPHFTRYFKVDSKLPSTDQNSFSSKPVLQHLLINWYCTCIHRMQSYGFIWLLFQLHLAEHYLCYMCHAAPTTESHLPCPGEKCHRFWLGNTPMTSKQRLLAIWGYPGNPASS